LTPAAFPAEIRDPEIDACQKSYSAPVPVSITVMCASALSAGRARRGTWILRPPTATPLAPVQEPRPEASVQTIRISGSERRAKNTGLLPSPSEKPCAEEPTVQ
jgi:hypothetical protein